ncbi:precorrin-2 C(20)-methyltransferase [Halorhodospira halophila]|uniref:Cobalt-factor II C20-methyltransferase n=1 Tax=Halorhodospira halophila (strain DSM 244 / SL1) TaxID=349124 RepID=A1WWQ2_HALHL|nr:precorrin-2 C(20)-methyltransferase [Halorhodospira halophila]ABM62114.1 cobalt-factor II C20-methyltransferase [Halorhodospira halophila SL1]MBK1729442.1 precorrin-2 C(20)-methyltransferase [Halorhodospira halophila]
MTTSAGRLIGVSLGPGDPGWITRRAWQVLQGEARWAYPVRAEGQSSYALEIVERGGLVAPADAMPLVFPMTRDPATLALHWAQAAKAVAATLGQGQDVAFLVEGDASTYATFGHLARTVTAEAPGAEVETIPGVASFLAAPARVGWPLASQDDALAVLPGGYGMETVERLLPEVDTLVLLKVKPLLAEVIDLLEEQGLSDASVFVERVGTPQERVVTDIARLRGETVHYLSLLMICKGRADSRSEGAGAG